MSHIIREQLWDGINDLAGHNPHTIQGFQIANHEQKSGITKDFLDLTDHLGVIPQELAWMREACPLLGGSLTVKNYSGPTNDFTETHPEMVPPNRQQECPLITIGKAGTLDIKQKYGSIYVKPNAESEANFITALKTAVLKNITVIYNYGDYDDARAPVAEDIGHTGTEGNIYVDLTLTRVPAERYGRVVVMVSLNNAGKTKVASMIKEKREISEEYYGGALNISDIKNEGCAWTEVLLVETAPVVAELKVSGAVWDADHFSFIHPQIVHENMDVPPERIVMSVLINKEYATKEIFKRYAIVPIWDYRSRTMNYVEGALTCTIKVPYVKNDGTAASIDVPVTATGTETTSPIQFYQIFPVAPVPVKCTVTVSEGDERTFYTPALWKIQSTPMFDFGENNAVFNPVRIEAFLADGYHFRYHGDPTITSKWTGTTPYDDYSPEAQDNFEGGWEPGVSRIEYTVDTGKTSLAWQGVPALDTGAAAMEFVTQTLPEGVVGGEYDSPLVVKGGYYSTMTLVANVLPKGLEIEKDEANNGFKVTGAPTAKSVTTSTIKAKSWFYSMDGEKQYTITIQ